MCLSVPPLPSEQYILARSADPHLPPPDSLLLNPCPGFWFGGRSADADGDQLR